MGRRNQSPSLYAEEIDYNGRDWISELPDVILIFILSRLTMEEAARTSVLSSQWKTLWANLPNLCFDASDIFFEIKLGNESIKTQRSQFRRWVNQVVKSYQGSTIKEFSVRFHFNETHTSDIDTWVHFAIRKDVKMLELDLKDCRDSRAWMSKPRYTFPCLRSRPLSFFGCNSLTFLRLNYVNITGKSIEYLLCTCLDLEQLFVEHSDSLVDLKVVGRSSLKLKILKICDCSVKNIEISAKNLVSFTYIGSEMNLSLKIAPQLAELYIGGSYYQSLSSVLSRLSDYIFQLESLTLEIINIKERTKSYKIPRLYNLKHLKLEVCAIDHESLLGFTSFIETCPFLCKFSLEFKSWLPGKERKIRRVTPRYPLKNLKVIEFIGFVGRTVDVEFATYLIESSSELEKVIFDTRNSKSIGTKWEYISSKAASASKSRAEQFGKKLPRGVELVII